MAVKTQEELLQTINSLLGDDPNEEQLAILEDFTDTFNSLSEAPKGGKKKKADDWEKKYKELDKKWEEKYNQKDKEWKDKYRARFYSKPDSEDELEDDLDIDDNGEEKLPELKSFDELFDAVDEAQ